MPKNIYTEIRFTGQYARVAAIDPDTNTEVVTVGPKAMGEYALRQAAVRKLEYVLRKKRLEDPNFGRKKPGRWV